MASSDSEDDENVIRYGTPLEPFEEDEVPSKRSKQQQQTDQLAVDADGRRRFHGAFTGGFSAGWGNSVGTPEGWTPATFRSSRAEKAQVSSQRPEDFMDDEDRSEFGIAPRHMQTRSEFAGQKRPRQRQYHDGPIPGEPVLEQLLRPVHETAAVRILKRMGWRAGQGAGARLGQAERRSAARRHVVYGCYAPPEFRSAQQTEDSEEDSSDPECDYETLFAPQDYEPYVLARKSDRFGLGYSGLSRRSVLGSMAAQYGSEGGSTSHLVMREKGKKVSIRGQAFGVGALEADDEDIYATEDMSHYDFSLGGPAGAQDINKKKAPHKGVLEGFVKASKPLPGVASHPPPALPRDFAPAAAGARRSRFEPSRAPQRDQGLGRHELTAEARGTLLGEEPLPPIQPPASPKPTQPDDPIAKLLGRNVNFVSTTAQPQTEGTKELDFIPITDSGKEVTAIFKPFKSDPQKQQRYEKFCKDREAYLREEDSNMDRLSAWERDRELSEFEQAAKLYQPLTGVMGDRFTHASQPDDAVNPLAAVARSSGALAGSEQVAAAAQGVYGAMTRRRAPWQPAALVCKRFNVPQQGVEPSKEDKPKVSYSIFSYLESSVYNKQSFAKEQSKFSGSKSVPSRSDVTQKTPQNNPGTVAKKTDSNNTKDTPMLSTSVTKTGFAKRMTVAELFLKESENDMKSKENVDVTETISKFDKMEIYKSIFLSDSESEEEQLKDTEITINFDDFMPEIPKNTERNRSPPRGLFANVDFDEINSWRRNAENKKGEDDTNDSKQTSTSNAKEPQTSKGNITNSTTDNDKEDTIIYGPEIPENLQKRLEDSVPVEDTSRPVFGSKAVKDTSQSKYFYILRSDLDEIRNAEKKKAEDSTGNSKQTSTSNPKEPQTCKKEDIYGPKVPVNLQKRLEDSVSVEDTFRPVFRSKAVKDTDIHVVDSSSSADSWVDINEVKSKKKEKKKKSKKHKHKHKKSKHKKKDK